MLKSLEDGDRIEVDCYAVFEDLKDDTDEPTIVLSILATSGDVLTTNSTTARNSFLEIADIFDDGETFNIEKISGETKAGRTYVNIALAM